MEQPLISVVICSYNYARFLMDAVRSVQSQSYADWECIIVDDASTDDTQDLVAAAARDDPRIRYLRNPRNLGVGPSRNAGNAVARGDWIAVLDADDWWHPDKLRIQLDAIRRAPGTVISFTAYTIVNTSAAAAELTPRVERIVRCPPECLADLDGMLRAENLVLHASVLASRWAVLAAGGYDETLPSAHDWDLYLRLLSGRGAGAFLYVDEPLAFYRVHGSGIRSRWRQMIRDERVILRRHVLGGGWAVRHPLHALRALDEQLHRESAALRAAGETRRAAWRAWLRVALCPLRRWRWRLALQEAGWSRSQPAGRVGGLAT